MIRCCQSMLTLTLSMPRSRSFEITCSVMPMFDMWIFIAGSEFLCSRKSRRPCYASRSATCADAVDQPRPHLGVRHLERVVVALAAGPDDHLRADARRRGRRPRGKSRSASRAHRVVERREPALAEARVDVQAARDRVDAVPVERGAHVVEVVAVELAGVVELVVVHQVAEPVDGAVHLLRDRLVAPLRLVAAGHEARDHRAEAPRCRDSSS